jgi:hypothetical protein
LTALVLVAELVLACLCAWLALPPRHGVTRDNYGRIEVGMTLEQVEAILGMPPGDHGQAHGRIHSYSDGGDRGPWDYSTHHWQWAGDDIAIQVGGLPPRLEQMAPSLRDLPQEIPRHNRSDDRPAVTEQADQLVQVLDL